MCSQTVSSNVGNNNAYENSITTNAKDDEAKFGRTKDTVCELLK